MMVSTTTSWMKGAQYNYYFHYMLKTKNKCHNKPSWHDKHRPIYIFKLQKVTQIISGVGKQISYRPISRQWNILSNIHNLIETVCCIKKKNLEQDADIHNCKTRKKTMALKFRRTYRRMFIHNSPENVYESREIDFLYTL